MIDKLEEELRSKETELNKIKLELDGLDGHNNISGEEGAEIRRKANELVLQIRKLEFELKKITKEINLALDKQPETEKLWMEGKSNFF